jgi:phosphotransferase system IIB component
VETIRVDFMRQYMHPWMLSYYIDRFSTLMARLELCIQISQLMAAGIDPQILRFHERSRNLWEGIEEPIYTETLPLFEKPDEPPHAGVQRWIPFVSDEKIVREDFFQSLTRVKRPEIWIVDPTPKLLFDIYSKQFLNLRSVTFESPGDMTFDVGSGLAEVIHEIRYGHRREQRERKAHEENMKQQKLKTERLRQQVLSAVLDNVKKMKEIGLTGVIQANLGETIQITVGNLEVLNEKARATLELPESRQPSNPKEIDSKEKRDPVA